MRILVTGSEGNIGTQLCKYLKACGHDVFKTDIVSGYADDYMIADVINPSELTEAFEKHNPYVVYHLAAIYGRLANERYSHVSVDTNITGTNNVVQLCKKHKAKLIHFSTSEVYGNLPGVLCEGRTDLKPNNRYGMLKLMCEKMIQYEIQEHGLNAVILRPNMVYSEFEMFGDYRSAMIRFVEALIKKQKITVYSDSERSWLYISDAVQIMEKAMDIPKGEIINVAHPEQIKTVDFAKMLCDEIGISYDDYVIEEPTPRRMTVLKNIATDKMIHYTGIRPKVSIKEGIKIVLDKVRRRMQNEN